MCQEQEGLARVEPLAQSHVPGHGVNEGPHPHLHTSERLRSVIPHTPTPEERGCNQLPVEAGVVPDTQASMSRGHVPIQGPLLKAWSWPRMGLCPALSESGRYREKRQPEGARLGEEGREKDRGGRREESTEPQ